MVEFLFKALFNRWTWIALAVAVVGYFGYSAVYERGHEAGYAEGRESRQAEIADWASQLSVMTAERNQLRNKLSALEITLKNAEDAHQAALKLQREESDRILASQKKQLDSLGAVIAKFRKELSLDKEVEKYVTPQADSRSVITAGFVWVHNRALEAGTEAAGVPASGPADVDAPSGIAASEVARVVAGNYINCRADQLRLIEWQTWYTQQYAAWKAAVSRQQDYQVVSP